MRGVVAELRAALAIVRAEGGDRTGAEALLARARADAPPADVRPRRHLEAAESVLRGRAAPRALRA